MTDTTVAAEAADPAPPTDEKPAEQKSRFNRVAFWVAILGIVATTALTVFEEFGHWPITGEPTGYWSKVTIGVIGLFATAAGLAVAKERVKGLRLAGLIATVAGAGTAAGIALLSADGSGVLPILVIFGLVAALVGAGITIAKR